MQLTLNQQKIIGVRSVADVYFFILFWSAMSAAFPCNSTTVTGDYQFVCLP